MSAGASAPERADGQPLVAFAVLLATYLQGVNISLPNAAVLHIQGALSMSDDEIGWVFSSYIAASAVVMPATRWLAGAFGRKIVFQVALAIFMGALVLVTRATTPLQFVAARTLQGAASGVIPPLAMAILLDVSPPRAHGRLRLAAAVVALVGILSGPGLGGWLAEYRGWRSMFYLGLPLAGLVLLVLSLRLTETRADRAPAFDIAGAAAFSLGVIGLQMFLDRGERLEWFASPESRLEAITAVAGFGLFLARMLTARAHFLDKALFRDRNFVLSTVMFFAFGFVLLPTVALTSPMLEELLGFPPDTTGYLTIPRSLALVGALVVTWREPARIDNRLLILGGMALVVYANARMLGYSPLMDWRPVAIAGVLQGIGLGVTMPALTRAAFSTLDPRLRAEGGELFNLARLYGSTIGIAVVQMLFYANTQAAHLALARDVTADRLAASPAGAGLAALNEAVTGQAAMIAVIDQFALLMAVMLVASPLALLLRGPARAAAVSGAVR
ncbi:MFS transporter [Caulobacter sp. KR2-114]|uniref:MFS transporter n=1 Tax=Caulobacter sp. KR2-114 TaxID=3400912 RepID=UPI003C06C359